MFFDVATLVRPFPWIRTLEERLEDFQSEVAGLGSLAAWPESHIYRGGWTVAPLVNGYQRKFGEWNIAVQKRCRHSAAIVGQIPNLLSAGFSQLAPQSRILPHKGYDANVLRVHLGLVVPARCGLNVGGSVRAWRQGECLAFDDTVVHEAWNLSDAPRLVLLIDIKLPGPTSRLLRAHAEPVGLFDRARGLSLTARYVARLGWRQALRLRRSEAGR